MKELVIKTLLPVVFVAGGYGGFKYLKSLRKAPPQQERPDVGVLVDVHTVELKDEPVMVKAFGSVQPVQESALTALVPGKVEWVSDDLKVGGFCKAGTVLIRLEKADYQMRVEQARAQVAKAEYDLEVITAQAKVARAEWEKIKAAEQKLPEDMRVSAEQPDARAMYEPQKKNAEAALDAARASLAQAELNLTRTEIPSPFDARVRAKNVDMGVYVQPGQQLAAVFAVDAVEVVVMIPSTDLMWVDVPGVHGGVSTQVQVILHQGERCCEWTGQVVRAHGEVDMKGRMVGLVVRVEQPYRDANAELRINEYVEVRLRGRTLPQVAALPREALRRNSTVWVAQTSTDGKEERMAIRPVTVQWQTDDEVFVSEGLVAGERVIVSPVAAAGAGIKVRISGQETPSGVEQEAREKAAK